MRSTRHHTNESGIKALRETENSSKVMEATEEAAAWGRMTTPRLMTQQDLQRFSVCRRIDVEEFRPYEVDEART